MRSTATAARGTAWYDANNFYGALHVFASIDRQSPATDNAIVIGPWSHGQWYQDEGTKVGQLTFDSKTGEEYQATMLLPFFDYHLKGKGARLHTKAYVYETVLTGGAPSTAGRPRQRLAQSIYLGAAGTLCSDAAKPQANAVDHYVSDPARPAPFVPGHATDMNPDYMAQDQRFVNGRPDVLVYQGEPEAEEMTIAGPVSPTLSACASRGYRAACRARGNGGRS